MRPGLPSLLLVVAFAAGLCACGAERPSVVLVTVDTLRADAVGAFGNPRARTPRMDRLAAAGTRFTDVRATCPLTLPSHLTILTGLLPPRHGVRDNDPARPVPPRAERGYALLAERFADAGYATAAFVSSSVLSARTGVGQGFDVYDEPRETVAGALHYSEREGGATVAAAIRWLAETKRPFFLWVHLFDPHAPYAPPVAFRSDADPTSPEAYADEVAYADSCVGRLLDAVDEGGTAPVVVLTADHGEGLGEHGEPTHGYLLYDTTLRVPLVIRRPGGEGGGTERDDPASLAALAPTILDAAGLETDRPSLLDGPVEGPVFAESLYGYRDMGWSQMLAVVDRGAKLISGATEELHALRLDPQEGQRGTVAWDGAAEVRPILEAALADYRKLAPLDAPAEGEELDPLAGLPYSSGLGRSRTSVWLSPEENRKLPAPDPGLAAALDDLKARVGRDDPAKVAAGLLALREKDPQNPSLAFWLGRNAMTAGRDQAAAAADWFAAAYRLGLSEAKVLDLWLKELLLAGRVEEAGAVIREHFPEIVPDAGTWVLVGTWNQITGNRDEAERCAARAADLAASDSERALVSSFRHNLSAEEEK